MNFGRSCGKSRWEMLNIFHYMWLLTICAGLLIDSGKGRPTESSCAAIFLFNNIVFPLSNQQWWSLKLFHGLLIVFPNKKNAQSWLFNISVGKQQHNGHTYNAFCLLTLQYFTEVDNLLNSFRGRKIKVKTM